LGVEVLDILGERFARAQDNDFGEMMLFENGSGRLCEAGSYYAEGVG